MQSCSLLASSLLFLISRHCSLRDSHPFKTYYVSQKYYITIWFIVTSRLKNMRITERAGCLNINNTDSKQLVRGYVRKRTQKAACIKLKSCDWSRAWAQLWKKQREKWPVAERAWTLACLPREDEKKVLFKVCVKPWWIHRQRGEVPECDKPPVSVFVCVGGDRFYSDLRSLTQTKDG